LADHGEDPVPAGDQPTPEQLAGPPAGPAPEAWRAGIDADRRKTPRRPGDRQRETLRRLTVTAATVAVGLNVVLFVQTGATTVSTGSIDSEIVAFIDGLFPGSTIHPSSQVPTPGGRPVVTTGAS